MMNLMVYVEICEECEAEIDFIEASGEFRNSSSGVSGNLVKKLLQR